MPRKAEKQKRSGKRRMVYMRDSDYERLMEISTETGLNFSAIFRTCLDFYYHERFLVDQKRKKEILSSR